MVASRRFLAPRRADRLAGRHAGARVSRGRTSAPITPALSNRVPRQARHRRAKPPALNRSRIWSTSTPVAVRAG
jgi:hypothetical protein